MEGVNSDAPSTAPVTDDTACISAPEAAAQPGTETDPTTVEGVEPVRDPRYPLTVAYCPTCSLPAELFEFLPASQFEKCKDWIRRHGPQYFPDIFPDECAARLEALKLAEETGEPVATPQQEEDSSEKNVKVAVPIEQKTSGGKKKKAAAEIVLMLGQRKGKKQVTIVYGLDLFGIKLKEAAKAAKRKFATGSSLTVSPDNREVIEIQGSRQEDMAKLVHKEWGVPQESIFIVNAQKKKVKAFGQ